MDRINAYKDIIKEELCYQASKSPSNAPDLKQQLIFDEERSNFLVIISGWQDYAYVHQCIFHVEVKEGLVYVHEDRTDIVLVDILIEKGIPKSVIVPSFLPIYERELGAYAVAA
ncbi:MAG: element excision factor XisI family protein [Bacteroidota bacterium]